MCVAGPQKCLAGPAAPTLVTVSADAWTAINATLGAPRGSYLSLLDWKERWLEQGSFPFTPLVSDVVGLAAACDELLAIGLGRVVRASRRGRPGVSSRRGRAWVWRSGRVGTR